MPEQPRPSPDDANVHTKKLAQFIQSASFMEEVFKLQFGLALTTDLLALSTEDVERLFGLSEDEKRLNFERGILSLPDKP